MINKITREIKLIDFGSTMPLTNNQSDKFYGTLKFAAPESLNGKSYLLGPQEVWTLGNLLFGLVFRSDPFESEEETANLDVKRKMKLLGKSDTRMKATKNCIAAITAMLIKDPLQRIAMDDISNLKFFRD